MKNLLLISITLLFISCSNKEYKYDITYTDGTHETVIASNEFEFVEGGDCIESCGCSGPSIKRCGVRKFDIVKETETAENHPEIEPADSSVVIEIPINLKN